MDERFVQHAQDTYRINQIQMASREQLLIITYDIGIRSCAAAEKAIEEGDPERINFNLQRAQAVIRELMVTLDLERGGDISASLMRLYDYMYYQLVDSNVKKEADGVVSVRRMLEELKATWLEAITKLKDESKNKPKDKSMTAAAPSSGGTNFAY